MPSSITIGRSRRGILSVGIDFEGTASGAIALAEAVAAALPSDLPSDTTVDFLSLVAESEAVAVSAVFNSTGVGVDGKSGESESDSGPSSWS